MPLEPREVGPLVLSFRVREGAAAAAVAVAEVVEGVTQATAAPLPVPGLTGLIGLRMETGGAAPAVVAEEEEEFPSREELAPLNWPIRVEKSPDERFALTGCDCCCWCGAAAAA